MKVSVSILWVTNTIVRRHRRNSNGMCKLPGGPVLPPLEAPLVAVLLLSRDRSVSCLMADLMSSSPPPPGHGDCNCNISSN